MAFLPIIASAVGTSALEYLMGTALAVGTYKFVTELTARDSLRNSARDLERAQELERIEFEARRDLQGQEEEIARRVQEVVQAYRSGLEQHQERIDEQAHQNELFQARLVEESALLERDKSQLQASCSQQSEFQERVQALFTQATQRLETVVQRENAVERREQAVALRERAHELKVQQDTVALTAIAEELARTAQDRLAS